MLYSGNCFFMRSKFCFPVGRSILFAAIIIGFVRLRSSLLSFSKCSSVQSMSAVGSLSPMIASWTIVSVTLSPDNCLPSIFVGSSFSWCICRASLSHPFLMMPKYHWSSSFSRNRMSSAGSYVPASMFSPFSFVAPAMSTICIKASACRKSSKNLLPIPFPSCAPGTSPATSRTSTGTNLTWLMHDPTRGLHCVLNSLSTHSTCTNANPLFGSIVVNGYAAIATSTSVSALKNVDFPTLGFPTTPMSMWAVQ